jgi:two-component system phosphate regulon sensor histidine kinase PhoR
VVILFFGYTLFAIIKQKRLSEVQRDFINNMTHELKTPISTIAVTADLLTNPQILESKERLVNYAHIIKNENARLQNQIEKVLQSARMDREKLELQQETIDLRPLLTDLATSFELKVKNEGGSLELRLAPETLIVWADQSHLTNIVGNLLDNALKYANSKPQIVIDAEVVGNSKKKKLHLSIQDNGIGIKKEYQKKIFEKFFRVPTGNIHNVKGFGLGLDYVRQIVEAHDWTIALKSELGQGSTFKITMPISQPKDQ